MKEEVEKGLENQRRAVFFPGLEARKSLQEIPSQTTEKKEKKKRTAARDALLSLSGQKVRGPVFSFQGHCQEIPGEVLYLPHGSQEVIFVS